MKISISSFLDYGEQYKIQIFHDEKYYIDLRVVVKVRIRDGTFKSNRFPPILEVYTTLLGSFFLPV